MQLYYSSTPAPKSLVIELRSQSKNVIFILLSQSDTAMFFQIGRI